MCLHVCVFMCEQTYQRCEGLCVCLYQHVCWFRPRSSPPQSSVLFTHAGINRKLSCNNGEVRWKEVMSPSDTQSFVLYVPFSLFTPHAWFTFPVTSRAEVTQSFAATWIKRGRVVPLTSSHTHKHTHGLKSWESKDKHSFPSIKATRRLEAPQGGM